MGRARTRPAEKECASRPLSTSFQSSPPDPAGERGTTHPAAGLRVSICRSIPFLKNVISLTVTLGFIQNDGSGRLDHHGEPVKYIPSQQDLIDIDRENPDCAKEDPLQNHV